MNNIKYIRTTQWVAFYDRGPSNGAACMYYVGCDAGDCKKGWYACVSVRERVGNIIKETLRDLRKSYH